MKFGSLFAGIGGIDLGLERAGMTCAWQVEIDEYCINVLNKHWPDVPKYKDVRDVGTNLETVDLIAGGFPCQPHSVAGKRRGADDDRNLWPEFIRIIRETRPRYVLAENVPGIISAYLDTVLSDLESEDYACWTFNIPACAFDAPHRRERIFVVARNPNGRNRNQGQISQMAQKQNTKPSRVCANVADTDSEYSQEHERGDQLEEMLGEASFGWRNQSDGRLWCPEPDVGRVAHGVPSRVDRLRTLGNAVVPQVAEWIGRRILEYDNSL